MVACRSHELQLDCLDIAKNCEKLVKQQSVGLLRETSPEGFRVAVLRQQTRKSRGLSWNSRGSNNGVGWKVRVLTGGLTVAVLVRAGWSFDGGGVRGLSGGRGEGED